MHVWVSDPCVSQAAPAAAELTAFLMQATSDLFVVCTARGQVVAVNQAWEAATGWSAADLVGQTLLRVVHSEDHGRAIAAGQRVREGEPSLNAEWRLIKPDGTCIVASWNVTVVGDLHYALGRDVTDIARTEKAFARVMRQRDVLDAAGGFGSWTHALGAKTVALSPGLAARLGLPAADSFTRTDLDAVALDLWPVLTSPLGSDVALKLGSALAPLRLRVVCAPPGADGVLSGVTIDETATFTALEAAEQARLRLELALDAGRAATWQLDLDPPRLWVSPQFEALIGRPVTVAEMLQGKGAATHPDDMGLTIACTKKLLANPGRAAIEHRIVRPDGEVRWVQTLCQTQADASGIIQRAVALTVDITERRVLHQHLLAATQQAESALAHRSAWLGAAEKPLQDSAATADFDGFGELLQRITLLMGELDRREAELRASFTAVQEARSAAEAANIAKSQFLANMSHELRTPINAIIGFGELIMDDAAGREPQIAADAERVVGAAGRLLAMINELLDLSRMEAGRLSAKPRAADLRALFEPLLGSKRLEAEAKGNRLQLKVDDDLATVFIDGDRLAQAVRHLLDNAVKFTSQGDIEMSVRRIETPTGAHVIVAVSDTGIGMTADDIATLASPLTQADGRSTRRHGGAGLGLAVAQRLAVLLGGELRIESVVGQGSTFSLSAPYWPLPQSQVA
jgi:PAS domain S-box-containing protein